MSNWYQTQTIFHPHLYLINYQHVIIIPFSIMLNSIIKPQSVVRPTFISFLVFSGLFVVSLYTNPIGDNYTTLSPPRKGRKHAFANPMSPSYLFSIYFLFFFCIISQREKTSKQIIRKSKTLKDVMYASPSAVPALYTLLFHYLKLAVIQVQHTKNKKCTVKE